MYVRELFFVNLVTVISPLATLTCENPMDSKFAAAILTAFSLASPAAAMSDADCKSEFDKAMGLMGKTMPANHPMNEATFIENCKVGVFSAPTMDSGAPLKGANSFTENQAKGRAMAAGFTSLSALKKDADGIWRGSALFNEKNVNVAIDFKGNVVAN